MTRSLWERCGRGAPWSYEGRPGPSVFGRRGEEGVESA